MSSLLNASLELMRVNRRTTPFCKCSHTEKYRESFMELMGLISFVLGLHNLLQYYRNPNMDLVLQTKEKILVQMLTKITL